jgi:hypothetical protein
MAFPNDQSNPLGAIPVRPTNGPGTGFLNPVGVSISTATTTLVKTGVGTVQSVSVNTLVASATITLYDALTATGTPIGIITLPSVITAAAPFSLPMGVPLLVGLTVVTSGATNITVVTS